MSTTASHFDASALQRITARVQHDIDANIYDGARIMVAHRGATVLDLTLGYADRAAGRTLLPDAAFSIMSISKVLTAVALLRCVERGQVSLLPPVASVIPEFAARGKGRVTVGQVLTHTAGLGMGYAPLPTAQLGDMKLAIASICSLPLESAPGEQVSYSASMGFTLVAVLTLGLVMLLLYAHFRHWGKVLLVMLCLPFSLVGGSWLVYLLGYQMSVAVAIGFIALAGVAAEFGIVMLLYLDRAIAEARAAGALADRRALRTAIMQGAAQRLRPKLMTVSVIVVGLLPVMYSDAIGADVMKRVAAPLIGGMLTAPLLSLLVIPTLYLWWQGAALERGQKSSFNPRRSTS